MRGESLNDGACADQLNEQCACLELKLLPLDLRQDFHTNPKISALRAPLQPPISAIKAGRLIACHAPSNSSAVQSGAQKYSSNATSGK